MRDALETKLARARGGARRRGRARRRVDDRPDHAGRPREAARRRLRAAGASRGVGAPVSCSCSRGRSAVPTAARPRRASTTSSGRRRAARSATARAAGSRSSSSRPCRNPAPGFSPAPACSGDLFVQELIASQISTEIAAITPRSRRRSTTSSRSRTRARRRRGDERRQAEPEHPAVHLLARRDGPASRDEVRLGLEGRTRRSSRLRSCLSFGSGAVRCAADRSPHFLAENEKLRLLQCSRIVTMCTRALAACGSARSSARAS